MNRHKHSTLHIPHDAFDDTAFRGWHPAPRTEPTQFERWLLKKLLAQLGDPPIQLVLWNGEQIPARRSDQIGRLHLRDRPTLWQLALNPDLKFGDAYCRGSIEVDGDPVAILEAIYRSIAHAGDQQHWVDKIYRWLNRARPNSLRFSRENVAHHYDIGNDFFRLWLDQEMVYTCAYFPDPAMTLEAAQLAKMDLVCRKLRLKPGETVIEAGCGWGALARHMAKHYGVKVRAYNLAHEQIEFARDRADAEGLARSIEYIEDDYRNIEGRCDAFVSVGMLEHVGRDNYRTLGDVIDQCLKADGRGLIHSIGRDQACPMNAWIEKRIFPGSYPPTVREMMDVLEPHGFSVLDIENLRLHYAKTLEHWLARFEREQDAIRAMSNEAFVRAWRLYLAGSLAGFTTGWLQLFQVVFARSGMNKLPWSRDYLYTKPN